MYQKFILGIAILIENEGKILLARRAAEKDFGAGLWELPSGRIETGETIEEGLKREALEELSIEILSHQIIDAYTFLRDEEALVLLTYYCTYSGSIKISEEHSQIKWVTLEEARNFLQYDKQRSAIKKLQNVKQFR